MLLQVIDLLWVEHLEIMDYLRSSVNLRAYGQRDPFIEYRKEALRLFKELEETFVERCQEYLPQMGEDAFRNPQQPQTQEVHDAIKTVTQRNSGSEVRDRGGARQSERKIGRNEVVTITDGSQTKQMKYKKAEEYLASGWQLAQDEQK
jgi:preprotein translocase subunit SecA